MENINRKEWIDIMKGLGITWIIIYHRSSGFIFSKYTTSFFIPLFFILAGYCYNEKKNADFLTLLKNKAKRLLVPYVFFTLLPLTMLWITKDLNEVPKPYIVNFFYLDGHVLWNGPLWFLGCMFTTTLLFWIISKYIKRNEIMIVFLAACSVMGYLLSFRFNSTSVEDYRLPFGIDVSFTAVVFYGIGWLMRKCNISHLGNIKKNMSILCLVAILIHGYISIYCNEFINMSCNFYGNYTLFYFCAFLGIFSTYIEAIYLKKTFLGRIIEYYGKNSLVLMCTHIPLFKVIGIFCRNIFLRTGNIYVNEMIILFLTFILSVPVIEIINRKFPFIIGMSKLTKKACV